MIKPMKQSGQAESQAPAVVYQQKKEQRFGERLARNLALSGMLVLAVAAAHDAKLPQGETVLTAVREMIDPSWEEPLGKIRFVGGWLPESVAVFFESPVQASLTAPCFGAVLHPWTEAEPYLGYQCRDGEVYAAAAGQVMSVAHGLEEERVVRVRHDDGLETLYYNLATVLVREGDEVGANTCLGRTPDGAEALMEVRRAGRAIDPGALLSPREAQK